MFAKIATELSTLKMQQNQKRLTLSTEKNIFNENVDGVADVRAVRIFSQSFFFNKKRHQSHSLSRCLR